MGEEDGVFNDGEGRAAGGGDDCDEVFEGLTGGAHELPGGGETDAAGGVKRFAIGREDGLRVRAYGSGDVSGVNDLGTAADEGVGREAEGDGKNQEEGGGAKEEGSSGGGGRRAWSGAWWSGLGIAGEREREGGGERERGGRGGVTQWHNSK